MRSRATFRILTIVLSALCLTGSWNCRRQEDSVDKPKERVRIGYLRLLSAIPLYAAIHEGYFERENISVETRTIKSGPEGNEALAGGNIDVAFSIVPSLLIAKVRGVPPDLVSIFGATVDGPEVRDHRIVVKGGSKIAKATDLRGKKIAVVGWPGPTSDVLELLSYFERHGLDQKALTLVGMGHPDMPSAVASGTVDAAALAEPYITLGMQNHQLATLSEDEGYYYDPTAETEVTTYLARRSWLDANNDLARRFARALEDGRKKAQDNEWLMNVGLPEFNSKARIPIDFVEITSAQSRQLRLMPVKDRPSVPGMQRVADQLVRFKFLPTAPSDLSGLVWSPR